MREKIILLLLILLSVSYESQKITVRGIARDITKNRNFVMVVVNDTLRKHRNIDEKELHFIIKK